MTAQDAYLAHIVARIDADVQFLVEQGALSHADAHDISARLVNANAHATTHGLPPPPARTMNASSVTSGLPSVAAAFKRTVAPPPAPTPTPAATPMSMPMPTPATTPAAVPAPPQPSGPVILRALWDWNDENDLSFKAGDRIELIVETSPEWWTGRIGARTGLFPSNYVERLEPETHTAPSATYKTSNFGSYNNSSSSHPTTDSTGSTQPAPEEQKKGKFGGLGKTMANGAAGGVGFGAGAAIGSGIINAIF